MAKSTCIKCDSTSFEMVEQTPHGSVHVVFFVQCAKCGGVVGVQPYFDVAELLVRHHHGLTELAQSLGRPLVRHDAILTKE